jgi:adenylate cyclase
MQQAMDQVNVENVRLGLPVVTMGIGLNTGEVVVGNIGSEKRAKYSIVGRHVNIVARVEPYTVGGQIYLSQYTRDAAASPLRIDGQTVVVPKGVREALTLFEIGGIGAPFNLELSAVEKPELALLKKELEVCIKVVEEKDTSSANYEGQLVELSPHNALLRSAARLAPLDNVKITWIENEGEVLNCEIYAKILHSGDGNYMLHFTSLSQEAELYLQRARAECT